MSLLEHRIRRATLDDIESLKELWASMNFDVSDLEKRLTEFQIAVSADGKLLGAVGLQISRSQARLHNEAFADFSLADDLRSIFWKRFQTLASSHGALRIWTREKSPFWKQLGFEPASMEILEKLPESWDRSASDWLTLPLKDEEAIAKIEREVALAMTSERRRSEQIISRAKTFNTFITIIGFLLAFGIIGAAIWLYFARTR